MAPRHSSQSIPLSTTPKQRREGGLAELLQQFGSKSSATSVTKARRVSVQPLEEKQATATRNNSKLDVNQQAARNRCIPSTLTPEQNLHEDAETSEDELARSVRRPPPANRPSTRRTASLNGLEMENQKKERPDPPRRSLRNRDSILESDTTLKQPGSPAKKRKKPPKLDTARQRLRDEISLRSKAKANNFLVANKDYFLPLLPPNNHIAKLVVKDDMKPIVEYGELAEQPQGVTAVMKPYQLSGLSFLVYLYNNGFSGILGDEMGLGKTLQTLSLFQYLEEQDKLSGVTSEELRPHLVICPLSVLNSWVSEAQQWVPNLKVLRFHGTVNERNRLKRVALGMEDQYGNETIEHKNRIASRKAGLKVPATTNVGGEPYKIIVTTYEVFQAETSWFKRSFIWRYVVLDEGHKIKNSVTQISAALRNVSSEYRLILTGTPLQNNLVEMWALLAWLYPEVFTDNTATLFKESFDLARGMVNQQTMDNARKLLELIMLRRMKDSPSVNLGLPPKEEILLFVPLTPMQRFWYTRLLTRVEDTILDDLFSGSQVKEKNAMQQEKDEHEKWARIEELQKQGGVDGRGKEWEETAAIMRQALEKEKEQADTVTQSAWTKLLNLVIQLRKCCSHPYLLPGAVPEPYYLGEHVIRASGKFILLEKLLKHTIFEKKKKALIFSGFTRTLDCCEDLLTLIGDYGKKFKYLRLDGGTARARRNLDIHMFNQKNSEYKVMLLSTRAGGLGINLTSAEDVIFLDEDWNPQITLQAEARAHRIGQTKKVTIYKLCSQGTVEEQMMSRIQKKLYLSAKITESMRNIHGRAGKINVSSAIEEEMPQLSISQLKSLVRRGAQTLSHPEIDVTEMLSWDLDTMLEKCQDKGLDPLEPGLSNTAAEVEEKWLSAMERVECAVFDGKRYHRQLDSSKGTPRANILPSSMSREHRRKGKNMTVMVNGFAISKESLNCADWEAVPTFAGKDTRLAEPKRVRRREISHEGHCVICFNPKGVTVPCKNCPRVYHVKCLAPEFQAKIRSSNSFHCPQHECHDCGKKTSDAGGLIYRCRWCERGYCEDCLAWGKVELIGDNLPEYEMLNEGPNATAFYVRCSACTESIEESGEKSYWVEGMEQAYREMHEAWLKEKEKEAQGVDQEENDFRCQATSESGHVNARNNGHSSSHFVIDIVESESDFDSLPSLTDTSLQTPVPGGSGISTPTASFPSVGLAAQYPQDARENYGGKALAHYQTKSTRIKSASTLNTAAQASQGVGYKRSATQESNTDYGETRKKRKR
ncbi:hypothetical protein CC78DRAFT_612973 [Lojkania enalia]|uniref:ISWI chromatin-remodeling complex ATPase ISW2 n=1 Tax=Lojkania enalia TaxID=147567 RepID=A0A9P4KJR3_9PLEO|nr:hypothetical protein CC78DRAFT_612973 [Didymosphaeria enalia]